MTFVVLGIFWILCLPAYCCHNVFVEWNEILIDGKDVTDNEYEVRPGQNILFKVKMGFVDSHHACEWRKVNFRFTKIETEGIEGIPQGSWTGARKGYYEETDLTSIFDKSQVGIHWLEDGKIVAPGRYLVEVQAPHQDNPLLPCTNSSNILTREVVFKKHSTVPDEIEFDKE